MLETKDLILDRGKPSDWKDMYENVWTRPECNRYMFWELCGSEEEARDRMIRTARLQAGTVGDPRSAASEGSGRTTPAGPQESSAGGPEPGASPRREGFTIYEKSSGKAIGFYNIEEREPGVWGGMGLCVGADYFRRGYGTQALEAVLCYCREELGAESFIYTAREGNEASIGLAKKLGFSYLRSGQISDWRNGEERTLLLFEKALSDNN